jgi:ABC-type glycerol-3-phosphate transport system substrate-binding protein
MPNRGLLNKMIIAAIVVAAIVIIVLLVRKENITHREFETTWDLPADYATQKYVQVSDTYQAAPLEETITLSPASLSADTVDGTPYGYDGPMAELERGDELTFDVVLDEAATFIAKIAYVDVSDQLLPAEMAWSMDGQIPFSEAAAIKLHALWAFERTTFIVDRYENEVMPQSEKIREVRRLALRDTTALNNENLVFELSAGHHEINLSLGSGHILFGDVVLSEPTQLPSYDSYQWDHDDVSSGDGEIVLSARDLAHRNRPSIRLVSNNDPAAVVYESDKRMLNAIDGYSFRTGNSMINYEIDVPETGMYHLGLKYRQNYLMQMPVFRELRIDGEVPFKEASELVFHYTDEYQNILFGEEEPFMFYLEEGTHTIGLRVVLEPYRDAYETLVGVMDDITDLSLEIKKLTGNNADPYRTWDISTYIPGIADRLNGWEEQLAFVTQRLKTYSHHDDPALLTNIDLAREKLATLREDVDEIPGNMRLLSDGDTSAAQLLGNMLQSFLENGLDIQSIYVSDDEDLPSPEANVILKTLESAKRFTRSFSESDYEATGNQEGVIDVWVNHPRQYIEIMQMMIDTQFTEETGIPVKLSLMPDENKLILANAAGTSPDVALGVNHWIPYEFAIRGASLDLRQFEGYEEMVGHFAEGVLIPYAFEEGLYGLPETQNFWVTFYREDIMGALDLEVPSTWNDVLAVLPELQRFGMNYYEPLAFFKGFKPFVATMPFIYQFDGQLYEDDGMRTMINSEDSIRGIRLMSDLFTVYNMPKEVPNFYQHFRYGTLPIGISDLSTYLQLTIAAPEIAGQWSIAPHPGVEKTSGEVERWAAAGAQSSMILSNSDAPEDAWSFLQWWMSTDIQTEFAVRLQTTYGVEYLWNTANLEAFEQLPLPEDHIQVILEQWEYAMEASRIPGAYMVEREISNAWNKIVFDDANPRIALDEAAKTANREILYKMEEFDYVMDGIIIRNYKVPTIYNIRDWLTERDRDV